ncbi:MAG: UDP-glucose 4-epimerase GalE [Candidatus Marinimicrobia bacterium]|nr:UDP-glucose 4-epimerase GalE [Candidatus Neomarinimicrobiota bacterium]
MNIFITGGAGYIGSHVAIQLLDAGHKVTVYDDLSLGSKENIDNRAKFIEGSTLDINHLKISMSENFDLVIHLAAYKAAEESMILPSKYSNNNINGSINLLNLILELGIKNLIFSSTAAVYGYPNYIPVDENHELNPINFYGHTKLVIENLIQWYAKLGELNYVIFRFFNAAGYDTKGRIKCIEQNPANLLPIIMETANKSRKKIEIFGDSYDTPDGTGVRDYIHVSDLARAHENAINFLSNQKSNLITNLATGEGYSVHEIIKLAEKLSGDKINYHIANKRDGDPPVLIASSKLATDELNWKPKYPKIDTILDSRWSIYKDSK